MDDLEHIAFPLNENYLITRSGKIFSLYSHRYLTPTKSGCYYSTRLKIGDKRLSFYIHRLVAECFVSNSNIEKFNVVNHMDGNKTNNHYTNLEWTDLSGNIRHCIDKIRLNHKNTGRRVNRIDLKTGLIIDTFISLREAFNKIGLTGSVSRISAVCKGKAKEAYGYGWSYVDNEIDISNSDVWKPIPNFERYYASINGEIYSTISCRILTPHPNSSGYLSLGIYNSSNKVKSTSVHRLIASAFLQNINNYPIVDHIDENKLNNCVDNLRWCTVEDNVNYVIENGRGRARSVIQYDQNLNFVSEYISAAEAMRRTGVRSTCIISVCLGQRQTAGSFIWRYAEDKVPSKVYSSLTRKGTSKGVAQIDINGMVIAKYTSQANATKSTGISGTCIGLVCQGKRKHTKGTYWRFLEEGGLLETDESKYLEVKEEEKVRIIINTHGNRIKIKRIKA